MRPDRIWEHLKREAQGVVRSEPVLASLVDTCILSRADFGDAMSMGLAQKLCEGEGSASTLHSLFAPILRDESIAKSSRRDLSAVLQRDPVDTNADWKIFTPPGSPVFQCADAENRLWFLTRDGHILQFFNGEFKLLADDGGLAGSAIYTLVADPRGNVWAGAENEIARWNGKFFEAMTPTNGEADIQPRSLYPLKSGALWVLDGERLRKMEGRAWTEEIPEWRGLLGPASGRATGRCRTDH